MLQLDAHCSASLDPRKAKHRVPQKKSSARPDILTQTQARDSEPHASTIIVRHLSLSILRNHAHCYVSHWKRIKFLKHSKNTNEMQNCIYNNDNWNCNTFILILPYNKSSAVFFEDFHLNTVCKLYCDTFNNNDDCFIEPQ